MFGLFKNRKGDKDLLCNWQIPIDASFKRIQNSDSLQFVNEDQSRILYFSILHTTGKSSIHGEAFKMTQPSITDTEHGWQLKGVKDEGGEILICVFTFRNENDKQWAKGLFTDILYIARNKKT